MTFGSRFLICLAQATLKLLLLPLLVAVMLPISVLLRIARFLFAGALLSPVSSSSNPTRTSGDAGSAPTINPFCVVVMHAASSFEAEAIVRFYAANGAAVIAVDRNVAVLSELFKHETRHVTCVGLSSSGSDSVMRELVDAVVKTRKKLFGVIVVEPSGECVLRRLLEREAIQGNNLRAEKIAGTKTAFLAHLTDFVTARAETTSLEERENEREEGVSSSSTFAHLMLPALMQAHHSQSQAMSPDVTHALVEVSVSQPCKMLACVLNALLPVAIRDAKHAAGGSISSSSAAASSLPSSASAPSFFASSSAAFFSLFQQGRQSGGAYAPRVTYVSRKDSTAMATVLAYILAEQQQLISAHVNVKAPLLGFSKLRTQAMRALLMQCTSSCAAAGVSFCEVSLFMTAATAAAASSFELRVADFDVAGGGDFSITPDVNRQLWRVPSVIHGNNEEILASFSSSSPNRGGASSSAAAAAGGGALSTSPPAPAARTVPYTDVVLALGSATATAAPSQTVAHCLCLQPAELSNEKSSGFVTVPYWQSSLKAWWIREEMTVHTLLLTAE